MKVCYVITKAKEIGGAQIHVLDLAIALKSNGNDVTVIVGEYGDLVSRLEENNIKVFILDELVREISPIKDLICTIKMRILIKKINPDIIGLHSSKAGIIGRLAALGMQVPVVFTAHGWSFADGISEKKRYIYMNIERFFSQFTSRIITVSEQDKQLALSCRVANVNQQIVIHNGVHDIQLAKKINVDSNLVKIISVARLSPQKDHATLLNALAQCGCDNWELTLVGDGPDMDKIKKQVSLLEMEDKVFFVGEVRNVASLLSKSDIFVLSSNWEGFPMSILEAMRASLPVVVSDVGGCSESVLDGVNGFLVSHKNKDALSEKLNLLIRSKKLRVEMGEAGRYIYLNNFTFDKMYEKTYSLYCEICNK